MKKTCLYVVRRFYKTITEVGAAMRVGEARLA